MFHFVSFFTLLSLSCFVSLVSFVGLFESGLLNGYLISTLVILDSDILDFICSTVLLPNQSAACD